MNSREFGRLMKSREVYRATTVPDDEWIVVRVDGRGFTKLTNSRYDKPFDRRFADAMEAVAEYLLSEVGGVFAFAQSDEVSVVFTPGWDAFNRRVEKIVSVTAAAAAAAFTHATGSPAMFDSRLSVSDGDGIAGVVDYCSWRQADAARNALNSWVYWTQRHDGATPRQAESQAKNLVAFAKRAYLSDHGVDFDRTPGWQRNGTGFWYQTVPHTGVNPVTGEPVDSTRRDRVRDQNLPVGDAFRALVHDQLYGAWQSEREPKVA